MHQARQCRQALLQAAPQPALPRPRRRNILKYRFLLFAFNYWAQHCEDIQTALREMSAELRGEPEQETSPCSSSSTALYSTEPAPLTFDSHMWHRLAPALPYDVAGNEMFVPHARFKNSQSTKTSSSAPHSWQIGTGLDFGNRPILPTRPASQL